MGGTQKMYEHLLTAGYGKSDAARIAQAKTGLSLVTGRPPQVPRRNNAIKLKRSKRA